MEACAFTQRALESRQIDAKFSRMPWILFLTFLSTASAAYRASKNPELDEKKRRAFRRASIFSITGACILTAVKLLLERDWPLI
jgi:hypothetical protein